MIICSCNVQCSVTGKTGLSCLGERKNHTVGIPSRDTKPVGAIYFFLVKACKLPPKTFLEKEQDLLLIYLTIVEVVSKQKQTQVYFGER